MVIFKNYLIRSDEIGFESNQIFSKNIFQIQNSLKIRIN